MEAQEAVEKEAAKAATDEAGSLAKRAEAPTAEAATEEVDAATKKKQQALEKRRLTIARKKAAKAEAAAGGGAEEAAGGKAEEEVVEVPSQDGKAVMTMLAQVCQQIREAPALGYDH